MNVERSRILMGRIARARADSIHVEIRASCFDRNKRRASTYDVYISSMATGRNIKRAELITISNENRMSQYIYEWKTPYSSKTILQFLYDIIEHHLILKNELICDKWSHEDVLILLLWLLSGDKSTHYLLSLLHRYFLSLFCYNNDLIIILRIFYGEHQSWRSQLLFIMD